MSEPLLDPRMINVIYVNSLLLSFGFQEAFEHTEIKAKNFEAKMISIISSCAVDQVTGGVLSLT